jgi:hypothetical protein
VFESPWTWLVPLVATAATFVLVLGTTPPGFGAISDVLLGSLRGANADAAAYALGAASTLALGTLLLSAALTSAFDLFRRRRHR